MGPLQGIRIVEVASLGPGPFCGMMLADMGAEVIRVERAGTGDADANARDPLLRNRKSFACDLGHPRAIDAVLRLVDTADGMFEGFRPGVAERLGLGPDTCLERNAKLVYGRMTGWGQDGPLAKAAGHDLNYIALSGALHMIGRTGDKPVPPLNLVGDFGGGGMLLAFGMLCALLNASRTGIGQVVDAAMLDGANALMAMFHGFSANGLQDDNPGSSFLGVAAHFYDTYKTLDGKYISIAPIEKKFYEQLIERLGLNRERFAPAAFRLSDVARQRMAWPELKKELTAVFLRKTRDEWCDILEGSDACFAPVLTLSEAPQHKHNRARDAFVPVGDVMQAAPAPRYSRSRPTTPEPGAAAGTHSRELLRSLGYSDHEIEDLVASGAVFCP
jgi:alpha-methylacyl-CoA racemase